MKDPYDLKLRDFCGMTRSDGLHTVITVEDDRGGRRPWIACYGLSFADGQTAVWSYSDLKYDHDSYVRLFYIPLIGFKFRFWAGGSIHLEAYVKPRLNFDAIDILPPGFEDDPETNAKSYQGRPTADTALQRYLLGRKLEFTTHAAGQPKKGRRA